MRTKHDNISKQGKIITSNFVCGRVKQYLALCEGEFDNISLDR